MNAPGHLGEAGAAFYARVAEEYDLSLPEQAALLQVAETLDTIAELEAAIRKHGRVDPISGKPTPAVQEVRQQRAILVRLLGLLDLPLDESDGAASSSVLARSRAAQKAARARWDRNRKGA